MWKAIVSFDSTIFVERGEFMDEWVPLSDFRIFGALEI